MLGAGGQEATSGLSPLAVEKDWYRPATHFRWVYYGFYVLTQPIGIPLISSQIKHAATVMARAFYDDPFFTFALPDTVRRARILPWLFEKTIRYGQRYGKIYTTPSLEGFAMWLGPKNPTMALMGTFQTGLFLLPLKLRWRELVRSMNLANYADQLHKKSFTGRHWYLYGLGVEPSRQGQGVGRALLQPVLAQADREALICYLDTNNEKNIPFYERSGFAVVSHGQASHTGPHTWAMLREPD
jgi:ribosomal protein S18 acetylase RimI-like enzyme